MTKEARPIITLTTDFGGGHYVGAMKGVILDICPDTSIVDITHDVASHNILDGAFSLLCAYSYFPSRTVHLAVVDPGVGSDRRGIVVVTEKYFFVGPDNGIFSFIYNQESVQKVIAIESDKHTRQPISPTFHGRDVFAPIAAWLVRGTPIEELGTEIKNYLNAGIPPVKKISSAHLEGTVIHIDTFGNVITNITPEHVSQLLDNNDLLRFSVHGQQISQHYRFYAEAPPEQIFYTISSSGYYEIAISERRAADTLEVEHGHQIDLEMIPHK